MKLYKLYDAILEIQVAKLRIIFPSSFNIFLFKYALDEIMLKLCYFRNLG